MSNLFTRLSIFLTLLNLPLLAFSKSVDPESDYPAVVDLTKFEKPGCYVGKSDMTRHQKVAKIRELQTGISRSTKDFRQNKILEDDKQLKGSAKDIVSNNFKKSKFNWVEREFGFFVLTLFGEARNLDKDNVELVAKVINNRKGEARSYESTVTELAQFTSWYYKNQFDNMAMLCPDKASKKHWDKIYRVAVEQFQDRDHQFKSKFYFAPHNMYPKHKVPSWSKGKKAIGSGGHIFIVSDDFVDRSGDLEVVEIPSNAKKIKVKRGKISLYN